MDKYAELLAEIGVPLEIISEPGTQVMIRNANSIINYSTLPIAERPIGFNDRGHPQYSIQQYNELGRDIFKLDPNIEILDVEPELALDWADEVEHMRNARKKHFYDRKYRLKWSFYHLIAANGKLPNLDEIKISSEELHSRKSYEKVRICLKKLKRPDLYISIPLIIKCLGGPRWIITSDQIYTIINESIILSNIFDTIKQQVSRIRFPKILFVLLWLCNKNGIATPYKIQWARTSNKRKTITGICHALSAGSHSQEDETQVLLGQDRGSLSPSSRNGQGAGIPDFKCRVAAGAEDSI